MMPHLGVLSTVNEKAATDVFVRDCMVYLGTCAAPVGQGKVGQTCAEFTVTFAEGRAPESGTLQFGDLRLIPVGPNERAQLELKPGRNVDAGAGKGTAITREVRGGVVGLLLDGRGRPLQLPADSTARIAALTRWQEALDLYPGSRMGQGLEVKG